MRANRLVRSCLASFPLLTLVAAQASAGASPGTCDPSEIAPNRAVARIVFEEILGKGRIEENESIYHPEFVAHGLTRDAGRAEDRAAAKGWREFAPDLTMTILRMVAECDLVAVHWEGAGTNTGTGNGLPATGRRVRVQGMTTFRLAGGRIREEWTSFDNHALLRQLGLLPE